MKAAQSVPSGTDSDNPSDILANFSRLTELRLRVAPDTSLGCVTISVDGLGPGTACLLSTSAAIALIERLVAAVGELRQIEQAGYDLGPPNLGPGSLSATF